MKERNKLTPRDIYKVFTLIALVFLYFILNVVALDFLFRPVGINLTKLQLFMVILAMHLITHRHDFSKKYVNSLRIQIHNTLLNTIGMLFKAVLLLFISFAYFAFFS